MPRHGTAFYSPNDAAHAELLIGAQGANHRLAAAGPAAGSGDASHSTNVTARSPAASSTALPAGRPPSQLPPDQRVMARKMRNRESAAASRERARLHTVVLEDRVRGLTLTVASLEARLTVAAGALTDARGRLSALGEAVEPLPPMLAAYLSQREEGGAAGYGEEDGAGLHDLEGDDGDGCATAAAASAGDSAAFASPTTSGRARTRAGGTSVRGGPSRGGSPSLGGLPPGAASAPGGVRSLSRLNGGGLGVAASLSAATSSLASRRVVSYPAAGPEGMPGAGWSSASFGLGSSAAVHGSIALTLPAAAGLAGARLARSGTYSGAGGSGAAASGGGRTMSFDRAARRRGIAGPFDSIPGEEEDDDEDDEGEEGDGFGDGDDDNMSGRRGPAHARGNTFDDGGEPCDAPDARRASLGTDPRSLPPPRSRGSVGGASGGSRGGWGSSSGSRSRPGSIDSSERESTHSGGGGGGGGVARRVSPMAQAPQSGGASGRGKALRAPDFSSGSSAGMTTLHEGAEQAGDNDDGNDEDGIDGTGAPGDDDGRGRRSSDDEERLSGEDMEGADRRHNASASEAALILAQVAELTGDWPANSPPQSPVKTQQRGPTASGNALATALLTSTGGSTGGSSEDTSLR